MTTAFELGCLSAVKKAGQEPKELLRQIIESIDKDGNKTEEWRNYGRSSGIDTFYPDGGRKTIHTDPSHPLEESRRSPNGAVYMKERNNPVAQMYYSATNSDGTPAENLGGSRVGRLATRASPYNLREADESSAAMQRQRDAAKTPEQPSSKSLLSHLKNPYVLGGLGIGALGLGGYAAYKAYQGSKKKKKPASE